MTRKAALALLRKAGYENNRAGYTRLVIENWVSISAAKEQWEIGQKTKKEEKNAQ